ncbi:uncharacterized protein LOC121597205 [Anopheles merus]|uniref:Uncharacterized protein n=1 Tax=Anopheles merus TaxID=30066 RepID=A0A182V1U2_ANOME|nr:uncharacterized protein LOC121597205 [Anopheles merus]
MSQPSEKQTQTSPTYGTPTLNDWKLYLRNLQQLPTQQTMAARDSSSSESSFELEESFKALLQRKRQEMQEKACEEHFLAAEGGSRDAARSAPVPQSGNDSTFLERDSISNISDTSFEEMEKICAVLDKVNGFDTSVGAKEERHKPATATMPGSVTLLGDVTQLEEIDEPSGLWENTILPGGGGGGAVELSPVKRMHLLRPSTILEETTTSSAEASKNSSLDTFISAKQVVEDSDNRNSAISGSEVYRTAQDTFGTDSYARSSILDMDSGVTSDITAVDNRTRHEREEEESGYSKDSTREAGESLVDDMEQHQQQQQQHVIILDSSTSDCEEERVDGHGHGPAGYETLGNADPLESLVSERDESLLEREGSPSYYDEHGATTENYPDEMSVMDEMPDRFNDTLEETDFMLKQGMKLMALKKQQQEEEERRREESQHSYLYREQLESSSQVVKSRTNSDSEDGARPMLHTPKDKYKGATTPSGTSHMSYLTPTGSMGAKMAHGSHSGAKQTLFSSVGKTAAPKHPTPSGAVTSSGSFKKPVSRLPQLRVPAGRKFDHIVSPIGAYIKQTPQSMLQTKINRHNNMNLIDVLHSENRDSAISTGSSSSNSKENHGVNLKGYTSTLPGKGVISSNRAHVLDERNVVRIPGGEKMQKLINNSPTMVIRHEGRIKYAERAADGQQRTLAHNISALTDDSLVDLSVLSNDVSVRVLKDAKRYH